MKHLPCWKLLPATLFVALSNHAYPRAIGRFPSATNYLVYIGTFTGPKSRGIYVCKFDSATGRLSRIGLAAESTNPGFLAVHPNRRFLYAANEIGNYEGRRSGGVSAFAMDRRTGKLSALNEVASGGTGPCHLTVDKTGTYVLVANYDSGSVAAFPVLGDGRLGNTSAIVQHAGHSVNPQRQEGPHAHSINLSPDNRFAVVADLGLDELLVYRFDASGGTLAANDPPFVKVPAGSGPRHFTFHPTGKFAYAIEEMGSSVTAFAYDAAGGVLHPLETLSTLPRDFTGEDNSSEVQVHPSGRFLYGSNRGDDSIAVFAIDPAKGTLALVETVSTQGKEPRNFGIDPTGAYLIVANQNSDSLVVFRIDQRTGRLASTSQTLEIPAPACVKFVPMD